MKHSLYLMVLCLCFVLPGQAQVDPLHAQYLNNPLVINPAYSGLTKDFNANISYRRQWAGFEGSPNTISASAHTAMMANHMGVGVLFVSDRNGNATNTETYATYAYRISAGKTTLSFGLQAGFVNFKTDNSALNTYDPTDPAFSQDQNVTKPSIGAGAILHNDRFFIGLSVPQMLKIYSTFNEFQNDVYVQHYYLSAGYLIYFSPKVKFKPSMLLKAVQGAPLSADVNASLLFDETFSAGVLTRNLNTYGIILQSRIGRDYRLGYVFEMPTNKSVGARFTTHEISFGINVAIFKAHELSKSNF